MFGIKNTMLIFLASVASETYALISAGTYQSNFETWTNRDSKIVAGRLVLNGVELASGNKYGALNPSVIDFFESRGAKLTQYENTVMLTGSFVISADDLITELAEEMNPRGKCSVPPLTFSSVPRQIKQCMPEMQGIVDAREKITKAGRKNLAAAFEARDKAFEEYWRKVDAKSARRKQPAPFM